MTPSVISLDVSVSPKKDIHQTSNFHYNDKISVDTPPHAYEWGKLTRSGEIVGNQKRISKKDMQFNKQTEQGQRDKQWSTKHYTETYRSINTILTENRRWTQVPRKGRQFLFHMFRCVTLVINPVINNEWKRDRIVITTNGSFMYKGAYCHFQHYFSYIVAVSFIKFKYIQITLFIW
jgi:hypothetical protein